MTRFGARTNGAVFDAEPRDGQGDVTEEMLSRPTELSDADREALLDAIAAGGPGPIVDQLVSALGGGDRSRRAVTMLTWVGDAAVPPLIGSLREPARRCEAAVALGYIHDHRAVAPLSEVMLQDAYPTARRAAAWALGEIRHPSAIDALMRASADDDFDVRSEALHAFDRFGNSGVAVAAAAMLQPALEASSEPKPAELPVRAQERVEADDRLATLSIDELAELYDITAGAWDAAETTGDDDRASEWARRTAQVILEAQARDRAGALADAEGGLRRHLLGGRRRRLREQLRQAARG